MKKHPTLLFLVELFCSVTLLAQSSSGTQHADHQQSEMLDQNTSPLMMFGEDEKSPTDETSDPRTTDRQSTAARGAASDESSSEAAREMASGLAEEGEDESSLTLDHFRTALAQNPTATRFIIVEDEENEGALSIQPRAAGMSRMALKRNQAENETIADALREALATRHRGSSEIVVSFFDGASDSADAPLSAKRLGEILRKSDAAQKPIVLKKLSTQKTAPLSVSENEATSALDDSNVDEYLGEHIRSSILTVEKANVAMKLSEKADQAVTDFKKLQKATQRKKREQKVLESAVESDTESYLTPVTYLRRASLTIAQAELATSILQGSTSLSESKKLSANEEEAEQARKSVCAHIDIIKAAKERIAGNFGKEFEKCEEAKDQWNGLIKTYSRLIELTKKDGLDVTKLETAYDSAMANVTFWEAAAKHVKARESDQQAPLQDVITIEKVRILNKTWDNVIKCYSDAIDKAAKAALETSDWAVERRNAKEKQAIWIKYLKENTKAEGVQQKGTTRQLKAQLAIVVTYEAYRRAQAADPVYAWDTAIQKARNIKQAFAFIKEIYQGGINQAPQRLKPFLVLKYKEANEQSRQWSTIVAKWINEKTERLQKDREKADAVLMKLLQKEIRQAQKTVTCAQIEVNRLHDSWFYIFNTAEKKEAIDHLVQAEAALIECEADELRRKATMECFTKKQQKEDEKKAHEIEQEKEERLKCAGLIPSEKQLRLKKSSQACLANAEASKDYYNKKDYETTAKAYQDAATQQAKGNSQATKVYLKTAQALEAQAAAWARGDNKTAEMHKKIANILGLYNGFEEVASGVYRKKVEQVGAAAFAYEQAAEQQAKGNFQSAESYHKSAQAREDQATALDLRNEAAADIYQKIAEAQSGAAYIYKEATEERQHSIIKFHEDYYNSGQYMRYYLAKALTYTMLVLGDQETVAERDEELAREERQYRDRLQQAQIYENQVEALVQQARALAKQTEALSREDKATATVYGKIALAQSDAASAYEQAATSYCKRKFLEKNAQVYEEQAAALKQHIEALARGDQVTAEMYQKIALARSYAAESYRKANEEDSQESREKIKKQTRYDKIIYDKVIEARRNHAKAYEMEAAALFRGDQAAVEMYKKSEEAQSTAIDYYRSNRDREAAEYEEEAELWARGDEAGAGLYSKMRLARSNEKRLFGRTNYEDDDYYSGENKAYRQSAENYAKQAEVYKEQAETWGKDDVAAEMREKIAEAYLKTARAYERQANNLVLKEKKNANTSLKQAEDYEAQAEALARELQLRNTGR